ncbi:MAG: hypothetical protein ACLS5G_07940 [Streptococcus sp.]
MPRKEVRKDYILRFNSLPKAKILMRRPFDTGLEGDLESTMMSLETNQQLKPG